MKSKYKKDCSDDKICAYCGGYLAETRNRRFVCDTCASIFEYDQDWKLVKKVNKFKLK